ncbi:MAG: hypothetical protein J6B48_09415 [Clostridia bacterium]|nr:hypothetical protein [Clostridia bacterium]
MENKKYSLADTEKFKELAAHVGGERGIRLSSALADYYERIYSKELPEWFARLYDKKIGGFYFSNSARDNDSLIYKGMTFGLLPDADSTWQTLITLPKLGLTFGKKYSKFLPEETKVKIIAFLKGLQDTDGYFYHPQFDRKRNEEKIERRSRDSSRAVAVITALGALPTYDTPTGIIGDGILANGERVKKPAAPSNAEESKAEKSQAFYAPFMKDKESFLEHLSSLKLTNNSYSTGSHFITQQPEMVYRDKLLKKEGADYTLYGLLTDWLTENQLENGIWDEKIDYGSISGIMKICRLYSAANVMIPRAEKTVRAAISVITSDEEVQSITDIFNPWVATNVILSDLCKIGGEEGKKIAECIREELIDNAEALIGATADKLSQFKRADGAFSYPKDASGGWNMGMPLGIKGLDEGDINATHLAVFAVDNIYSALGLEKFYIPPYGNTDAQKVLDIITG